MKLNEIKSEIKFYEDCLEKVSSELKRLVKYLNREDIEEASRKEYEAIVEIHNTLQKKRKHADTTDIMVEVNGIISEYVKVVLGKEIVTRVYTVSEVSYVLFLKKLKDWGWL